MKSVWEGEKLLIQLSRRPRYNRFIMYYHSHIARLILTNKRWSGNVPDPYRKEGRREGLPSSWTGQRMDFSITFSSPPPHRWAGKNQYWNVFPGHKLALLYENVILTPIHSHMGKVHFAYNKRPENRCVLVCPCVPSCEVGKKTTLILCRREWISSVVFSGRRASERFPEFCTCEVGRENYTKNSFSAAGPPDRRKLSSVINGPSPYENVILHH